MDRTELTLDYYNQQAEVFASNTLYVDFSNIRNIFLSYIRDKGKILDLGCGSGRDSKAFMEMGFEVTALDGSKELCKIASEYIGKKVICTTFQDFTSEEKFDGVWACASLLHLEKEDIKSVMNKLADSLNEGGCFYASFKYGTFFGVRNGRFFTDMDEEVFHELLKDIPSLRIDKEFITSDVRPGRDDEKWLNVFLIKKA